MKVFLDALLVGATAGELSLLESTLRVRRRRTVGGRLLVTGFLAERRVGLLCTGMGKVNTALALGAVLTTVAPSLLLAVGVGGAYPDTGLEPGDLAVASEEDYGDEGVDAAGGWEGTEAIGIPLWQEADGRRHWNRMPVDRPVFDALVVAAARVGRAAAGPFVTVSTVTGTDERARWLAERFGALCETMEGAAAAHAALAWNLPFGEVRGISNRVGARDRPSWKLSEAAAAAQKAALVFLSQRP